MSRSNRKSKYQFEGQSRPSGVIQTALTDAFYEGVVHPIDAGLSYLFQKPVKPYGIPRHLLPPTHTPLSSPSYHGQDVVALTSGEASTPGPGNNKNRNNKNNKSFQKVNKRSGRTRTVYQPIAKSKTVVSKQPMIFAGKGYTRFVHSELLDTVSSTGTNTFLQNLLTYAINPGLSSTFPWLSTQALGFERYTFNSISFEYVARTATTNQGSILMAPDYDPDDRQPVNEKSLGSYQDSVDGVVWENLLCYLDAGALHSDMKTKYNRYGNFTAGGSTSIREYDCGNFYVNITDTGGGSTSIGYGKLWVHYDVVLSVPRVVSPVTLAYIQACNINGTATGSTVAIPFGTAPIISGGLFSSYNTSSGALVLNRAGRYILNLRVVGTGLFTAFLPTGLTYTDGDGSSVTPVVTFGVSNAASNAGTEAILEAIAFTFNQPGGSIIFNLTSFASTVTPTTTHAYIAPYSTTYDEFS